MQVLHDILKIYDILMIGTFSVSILVIRMWQILTTPVFDLTVENRLSER